MLKIYSPFILAALFFLSASGIFATELPFNPAIFRFALSYDFQNSRSIDWSDFLAGGRRYSSSNIGYSQVPRGLAGPTWYGVNNNGNHGSKHGAARSGYTDSPLAGSGLTRTGWTPYRHAGR